MNPKYTTKREAREALAALDLVKHTTGVMYNVIYRLMVKTAADLLRHFYKGPRWMWLAGKWVQLEAKGNMLFVHNEDGGLVLFDRDDIIDILDAIEAGQIYSHAGGGPYAPLRIDTEKLSDPNAHFEVEGEQKPASGNSEKPNNHAEWSELERAIHRGFLCAGVQNVSRTIIEETAQNCLAQMKPVWGKEDEERLSDAIFFVREYQISTRDKRLLNAAKESEDLLKSLPKRFNLQPKPEQIGRSNQ